jgi:hypothetical protein
MSEVQRLNAIRAALNVTTNTHGWVYAKQIADNIVKVSTQAAKDAADDDVKGLILLRKAKVAEEIFRDFFNAIETSKQFGTEEEPEWFTQLAFDEDSTAFEVE